MHKFTKRTTAIVAAAALAVVGSTVAYAYWTGTGEGTGTAGSGVSSTTMVANQTALANPLGPSVAAQSIVGTFTNSSAASVYVTSLTVTIASVTKAGGAPAGACTAADYVLAPTNGIMTVGQNVPVGTAQGTWGGGGAGAAVTLAFANSGANQDGCQGATVNLAYAIA